jgi:hypothetical protein
MEVRDVKWLAEGDRPDQPRPRFRNASDLTHRDMGMLQMLPHGARHNKIHTGVQQRQAVGIGKRIGRVSRDVESQRLISKRDQSITESLAIVAAPNIERQ